MTTYFCRKNNWDKNISLKMEINLIFLEIFRTTKNINLKVDKINVQNSYLLLFILYLSIYASIPDQL